MTSFPSVKPHGSHVAYIWHGSPSFHCDCDRSSDQNPSTVYQQNAFSLLISTFDLCLLLFLPTIALISLHGDRSCLRIVFDIQSSSAPSSGQMFKERILPGGRLLTWTIRIKFCHQGGGPDPEKSNTMSRKGIIYLCRYQTSFLNMTLKQCSQ